MSKRPTGRLMQGGSCITDDDKPRRETMIKQRSKRMVDSVKTRTAETAKELPPDVLKSDTVYPKWNGTKRQRVLHTLTFYKTQRLGWVITTLHIAKARRPGTSDRSYCVGIDGSLCRAGRGPHVLSEVTVYVTEKRLSKLQKYVDLHEKGLAAAGDVRDRISSR